MTDTVLRHPANTPPNLFTRDNLGWVPWLEPLTEPQLTEAHWQGLTEKSRAKSPYFMLLARDPEVLGARTRADNDIFYNTKGGLPRGQRELAATAASRLNGCLFCASVHARFAAHHLKQEREVDLLLEEGLPSPLRGRLGAVAGAAADLTATPPRLDQRQIWKLEEEKLDDQEIVDLILSAAFFNWANRLMLSLGEPTPPQ